MPQTAHERLAQIEKNNQPNKTHSGRGVSLPLSFVVGFFILSIFVTTALFLVVPLLAIANLFLWQSVYGPQLTPSEPQVLNDLLPYWAGFCFTVGFFLFFFLIWLTKNWQVYQIKTQQEAYTRALVEWSRYERTS